MMCVNVCVCLCRYNGGEGMVPGALFKKFSSRRQATVYVGKVTSLNICTYKHLTI